MNQPRIASAVVASILLVVAAAVTTGAAATTAAVPKHVLTGMHELCYGSPCYHPPQAVPLREVADVLDWALADPRSTEEARRLGIRTYAYIDPSIQYDPKHDWSPLYSEDESTFLRACDGGRATLKSGALAGFLMDLGSPSYRRRVLAYVDDNVRGKYDALFVDDIFAGHFTYATVTRPPCGQTYEREREATFGLWSQIGIPLIFNGLGFAPDDGRTDDHAQAALDGPGTIGGMYEYCLTAPSDATDHTVKKKRVDGAWRSTQNSHLQTIARGKMFLCYSASDTPGDTPAGIDERAYIFASFLLVYRPALSVLELNAATARRRVSVFPEETVVAVDPVRPQPADVEALRRPSGVYVREYAHCYLRGEAAGPCAAVVNPSGSRTAEVGVRGYTHAVAMHGGAIPDGGTVSIQAPVPSVLPPASGTVVFR